MKSVVIVYRCMFDLFCSFIPYKNKATPLYVASQNGHYGVVQSLLAASADVNIASSVSDVMLIFFFI